MLSDEGNKNGENTTNRSLIYSKKATLHVRHTFSYISLPSFCTTTTWNFQTLPSNTFYGGNVVRVLVHFFFTTAHFQLALVAAKFSHFLTSATKFFMLFFQPKMFPLFFISRSSSLRCFPRWTSLACRPLSLYLFLSFSLYSKFVDN